MDSSSVARLPASRAVVPRALAHLLPIGGLGAQVTQASNRPQRRIACGNIQLDWGTQMRRRLSYANVVATLALVFAMSGGALAANHYLINSTKQISPKLLKKLKGRAGRTGARGLPGAKGFTGTAGAQGKEGLPGKEGARGQSALQPLESGQTITGVGGARFQNGGLAKSPVGVVVSFPVRAPTPLSGARVELAPTVNCTGSTATPTAAPGFACIYEDVNVNVEKIEPGGPVTVPDPWGFMVDWTATAANQQSSLRFTWAYTAP